MPEESVNRLMVLLGIWSASLKFAEENVDEFVKFNHREFPTMATGKRPLTREIATHDLGQAYFATSEMASKLVELLGQQMVEDLIKGMGPFA